MNYFGMVFWTIVGTLIGCTFSLLPALHVYNLAGILLILQLQLHYLPPTALPAFFMSLVVAYAIMNTVPSMFLGAPDESAVFVVLPGQKYMLQGRGFEASVLTGVGGLCGIVVIALLTPFTWLALPVIQNVVKHHMHWIIILIITYMLMSEWPKGTGRGKNVWAKFADAWRNLFGGILTFCLSAVLGFIILNKSFVGAEMGFQNIMPVFVGLFAVAGIIQNLLSHQEVPHQHIGKSIDIDPSLITRGTFSGVLGGSVAAFIPAVTGGIGGLLAGHATAQRDDRLFVMSQGVSKAVYYIGSFLLYFVVAFGAGKYVNGLARGGMAMIMKPIFKPQLPQEYVAILGAVFLSGAISFILLIYYSRLIIGLIQKVHYHTISWVALGIIIVIIVFMCGGASFAHFNVKGAIGGLFVMTVSTAIGLLPVFFHCRRSNCMAVLLVPIGLNMGGAGPAVAKFLGLV